MKHRNQNKILTQLVAVSLLMSLIDCRPTSETPAGESKVTPTTDLNAFSVSVTAVTQSLDIDLNSSALATLAPNLTMKLPLKLLSEYQIPVDMTYDFDNLFYMTAISIKDEAKSETVVISPIISIQTEMTVPEAYNEIPERRQQFFVRCSGKLEAACTSGTLRDGLCNGSQAFCYWFGCSGDMNSFCELLYSNLSLIVRGKRPNDMVKIPVASFIHSDETFREAYILGDKKLWSNGVGRMLAQSTELMMADKLPNDKADSTESSHSTLHVADDKKRMDFVCKDANCLITFKLRQMIHSIEVVNFTGEIPIPISFQQLRYFDAEIESSMDQYKLEGRHK